MSGWFFWSPSVPVGFFETTSNDKNWQASQFLDYITTDLLLYLHEFELRAPNVTESPCFKKTELPSGIFFPFTNVPYLELSFNSREGTLSGWLYDT